MLIGYMRLSRYTALGTCKMLNLSSISSLSVKEEVKSRKVKVKKMMREERRNLLFIHINNYFFILFYIIIVVCMFIINK